MLSEFYSDFPTSKNALLLAVSQNRAKKSDAAINTLKAHLEKNDSDTQVRSLLANLYLENYPEKSIPLYEKMLIEKPENIVFLNNLAWLNLENNNLELAMKYSAEAVKLASKNPNVLDTRGMVLLKAGETAVALKALENAYELSNGNDVSIALNYAEALIANKKNKEALSLLKALNGRDSKQTQRINSLIALAS
ncbi:tetratricopeptide repeat protein [Colwellia sp. Arc7-635]|uniref:tetratricopeptide repeat protein n=1 Tax=Colwellia sp. Arc7-635 TaxID=2497879 RepID=UPI000F8529B7|nr:tetratricopeptide repeat protein [Colwellia sp. Arc7-635]AZQ82878.1 tetratricopeptide repeat protein [Colwellia sp. Arc7-635]